MQSPRDGQRSLRSRPLGWFTGWLVINTGHLFRFKPFDPYPFSFLTLVVSLEAIFLTVFVLMSQNRMARQADKRAHLDLQVDLLAEQELTVILYLLRAICQQGPVSVTSYDGHRKAAARLLRPGRGRR
jgi:uncharacterized membrane protein